MKPTQALQTTYPVRLGQFFSSALIGLPAGQLAPTSRLLEARSKSGTAAINYAELDVNDNSDPRAPQQSHQDLGEQLSRQRFHEPFLAVPKLAQHQINTPHRTDDQTYGAADLPTVLIPIRIDLDLPNGRLHDTFLWNLHETLITPDMFAATMGADLELPPHVVANIAGAIRDQLAEYAPFAQIAIPQTSGDMRAVCQLTVNLDDMVYTDQFEWDLSNTLLTPELFAKVLCSDLGLRSEFIPSIAASIYEFILQWKKDIDDSGLPELENGFAHQAGAGAGWRLDQGVFGGDWEPRVELLSREEIEKREIDCDRKVRRLRRETARFGTATAGGPTELDTDLGRVGRRRARKRKRSTSPAVVDGEWERSGWRCLWCDVTGMQAWATGEGPWGQRTLCWNCSYMWKETRLGLQEWAKGLHAG